MTNVQDYIWAIDRTKEFIKNAESSVQFNSFDIPVALVIKTKRITIAIILANDIVGDGAFDVATMNPEVRRHWLDGELAKIARMIEP